MAIIFVALIGGVYYTVSDTNNSATTLDMQNSFAYECTDGTEFRMVPAPDMSTIMLTPGANATFQKSTLARVRLEARYTGRGMTFTGSGEGVQLVTPTQSLVCNPVVSQDMAPFNWGDSAEGAGPEQDTSAAVRANIVGQWRSVQDPRFVREFRADGTLVDSYDDDPSLPQQWKAFSKGAPVQSKIDLIEGQTYIEINDGTDSVLTFTVDKLTPESLEMMYLEAGRFHSYTRIQ